MARRNRHQIMAALVLATLLSSFGSVGMAQAPEVGHNATKQVCQLLSANPPGFDPFQFVPKKIDFKQLNRFPKVEYVVHEDGNVSNVKVLRGTRSPRVNAGLVRSIQAWKYKPQPGCTIDTSMVVVIDIW